MDISGKVIGVIKVNSRNTIAGKLARKVSSDKSFKCQNDKPNIFVHLNKSDYSHFFQYDQMLHEAMNIVQEFKLNETFYLQPCKILATVLLGKILVRKLPSGEILKGKIVETECYLGVEDKASHSYKGKKTERNEAMFLKPGTAYVYSIYGMYYCFNISSLEEGSAVLIRAIEPLQGHSVMRTFRSVRRGNNSIVKDKDLCNGPSKLCQAFKIEKKTINKSDLCTSQDLWLEPGEEIKDLNIVSCKRIGISSAGEEWANKPLRYYIKDNIYVSIRDKQAEKSEHV